jgi:mannose-6-phosphate isomerase-like protein (cupin superfamily)
LINAQTVGARHLEINFGIVSPGGEAEPHFHSESEQALYLLEGRALVEVGGEQAEMHAGQIVFFPPGVRHKITVLGQTPMRALAIYSPPLRDESTAFETD